MMTTAENILKIDAVITWVDGNDPVWQEKFNSCAPNKIDFSNKKEMIRYNSIDEIEIAIQSIIKNAPFLKSIYLVTDNQKPTNLKSLQELAKHYNKELKVVDHTLIFKGYEEYLPTFNSRSITNLIYRIPDLSEHFIIFNDDTFLMRETSPSDFFIDGKPVIRGKWERFYEDKMFRNFYYKMLSFFSKKKKTAPGYKKAQQQSAKILGLKKYIKHDHTPVTLRRSVIAEFFEQNEAILHDSIKYKFRDERQFIISGLSNHLEVLKGDYILTKDLKLTYFQSYKSMSVVKAKLNNFSADKSKLFMCFQNLEIADEHIVNHIFHWVNERLSKN